MYKFCPKASLEKNVLGMLDLVRIVISLGLRIARVGNVLVTLQVDLPLGKCSVLPNFHRSIQYSEREKKAITIP